MTRENPFPPGWDEKRVRAVVEHYEGQSDEEALAEDEAAFEGSSVPGEEVEALWLDEAECRERAWDAGEVEGIPAEQVMRELRSGSE